MKAATGEEVALRGGRTTPGIVRVGDTVRRPRQANHRFVRHLLEHLAASGFDGVPRHLGQDEAGREIFSFIEGDVPDELGFISDDALHDAATLIRRFHDLGADLAAASQVGAEVICHNDLSPCNFVFRAEIPVAMIDFDATAPGTRAWDLGYAAWLWLDLGSTDVAPAAQRRRLDLFADAYGDIATPTILGATMERQETLAMEARRQGKRDMADWAMHCLHWTRRHAVDLE